MHFAAFDDPAEPMAWLEKMHFCQQSAIFTSQSEDAPSAELAELLDVRCQHALRYSTRSANEVQMHIHFTASSHHPCQSQQLMQSSL